MPRAPRRPCTWPQGCANLVDGGSRCPEHARGAWSKPDGRNRTGSGWAEQARHKRIMRRDNNRCHQCGAPANAVDHIVPRHLGGTDLDDNLQAMCTTCHATKTHAEAANARRMNRP